ncbi:hypothetical protein ANCCEY_08724 [Ancylostoma ceylanicum]|uniref:Uncharacterized protein n=1 Tax=Ancylostoma ceylanicum TaxID=53326 RepID=A0A0D6LJD6_9BILA|nr:hypothetical protein ANCCEY_08724 [Ancylostoma ceylanicum]
MSRIQVAKLCLIVSVLATLLALYSYQTANDACRLTLGRGQHHVQKKSHVGTLFKKSRKHFAKLQEVLSELVKKQELLQQLMPTFEPYISDKHEQLSYLPLRRLETAHVDCGRVLNGDQEYIAFIASNRPVLLHKNEERSCETIRQHIVPQVQMKKMAFGVAYARVVYKASLLCS